MISYSDMAQASPNPSYVDVPRPNSSIMISELLVAVCVQYKWQCYYL